MLLPGARSFFDEFKLPGSLNERHFVGSLQHYITIGVGFVLAAFDGETFLGGIAGLVFPDFATGQATCQEFFWYILPSFRGTAGIRLLRAFEQEAERRGAARIMMMHLVGPATAAFERIYQRSGYRMIEQVFTKELNGRSNQTAAAAA